MEDAKTILDKLYVKKNVSDKEKDKFIKIKEEYENYLENYNF